MTPFHNFQYRIVITCLTILTLFSAGLNSFAQELYPVILPDGLWHNEQRELRYRPDGEDFVITNGNRLFTRALYGTNTSFRVETGDRPEFAMYMSGMGGNFKLGIESEGSNKWLTEAKMITARYRPGSRLYTIEDPLFGSGSMTLEVLAMADADGFIVRVHFDGLAKPVTLFSAFGGASGKKFNRDGDMGTDPESVFYLRPENCTDNQYIISKGIFMMKYGSGLKELSGVFHPDAELKISDPNKQKSPDQFFQSSSGNQQALSGKLKITAGTDYYFCIYNPSTKEALQYADLPGVFLQAEVARKQLASRVKVNTPDPYINTIGGALAMASDAVWEEPSYLHGSIGWRTRLNGWRGAYTADVLGWHDRARMHLESYAQSQLTTPASGPVIADTTHHLARSLEKLGTGMFTSGYITRDPLGNNPRAHHYDMNLVYIDQLLRHYLWTGDMDFVKKTWPVLKRHLEWEKRNFDPDDDGLYDAYAAIWASDGLQYSGGAGAHSSAYNYYSNKKAAEIAEMIGEDSAPYKAEAEKILNALNKTLWMSDRGWYAEFKDALGNRLLHPYPAIWTLYHIMDSEVADPFQSYQSMRYVDTEIPHIPVRAEGLEDKGYYTISTTSWMPYLWSLNDVALAESMHIILANWQTGRNDEAFRMFKSEILAYMYLGGSPGNVGQISHYSVNERYRDFADPVGMFSRALVEGLFGILPDALRDTLTIKPGIPVDWDHASFSTPDISFDFKQEGRSDIYHITQDLPELLNLRFRAVAKGQVKKVIVNGKKVSWKNTLEVGKPVIEFYAPVADTYEIDIKWKGPSPVLPSSEKTYISGGILSEQFVGATLLEVFDPQKALSEIKFSPSGLNATIVSTVGNHTVFVLLKQGKLKWWQPLCFIVDDPFILFPEKNIEVSNNSFRLRNNTGDDQSTEILVNSYKTSLFIPSGKTSGTITVPEENLVPGTNNVVIRFSGNRQFVCKLTDWTAKNSAKTDMIDLSDFFNDRVTQIFRNKYLSPRPQVTTLQLPWQGIGSWTATTATHNIDDSGLRRLAGTENKISLPQNISFSTPGNKQQNNIVFTSQWDNYPDEITMPLTGRASHAWFLMAGSTNTMQSQLDNGIILIEYTDGSQDSLLLRNPETWWPIQEDYYSDGYAFRLMSARPVRIDLKSGEIRVFDGNSYGGRGSKIDGGAATVLDMPLDPGKSLKNITLRTISNDVVIGLMSLTLAR